MTNVRQKRITLSISTVLVFLVLVASMLFFVTPADAAESQSSGVFSVVKAQVKQYTTGEETSGALRFVVQVPESLKNECPTDTWTYGIILLPEDILKDNELTFETEKILNIETSKWQDDEEDENGNKIHIYTSVLSATPERLNEFINRPIVARAYITNGTDTHYSEGTLTRSTGYVATMNMAVNKWEELNIDIGSDMLGTKTPQTPTDEEAALGITSVTEYGFTGFQNTSFASLDLTMYQSVKFYLYRPQSNSGGSIKDAFDGGYTISYLTADKWNEIEIKRSDSGEGYDVYVDGVKKSGLKDGKTLTNLNQLTLNGSTDTVKYSNVVAAKRVSDTLLAIADKTDKSASFEDVTIVNAADKLYPSIVFGGVKVPDSDVERLNIKYSISGTGAKTDENAIVSDQLGHSDISAVIRIPGLTNSTLSVAKKTITAHNLEHNRGIAADCTTAGVIEHWYCSGCKLNYADGDAASLLSNTILSALGHHYNQSRVEPTYFKNGVITRSCTRCYDEQSVPIPAVGLVLAEESKTFYENANLWAYALDAQGGNEFEIQGTSLDKETLNNVAALKTNVQRGYLEDGTTFYPSHFRFKTDSSLINWTKYSEISFKVAVSTLSSNSTDPELKIGGAAVKFTAEKTWYDVVIKADGSVYFDGSLVDGAHYTEETLVFEYDNNRNNTDQHNHYGAFYISETFTAVTQGGVMVDTDVTLVEDTNVFASALDAQGGNEFAIQGTRLDGETWKNVAALKTNVQRGYLEDGTTTFYPSYFRFKVNVDFTKYSETTFKVAVSTVSSNSTAPEIIFGGVPVKLAAAETWYKVTVKQDGSVYFDEKLVEGAVLTGNSIVFEYDNNRNNTDQHNHYGAFYIAKTVTQSVEKREYPIDVNTLSQTSVSEIGGASSKAAYTEFYDASVTMDEVANTPVWETRTEKGNGNQNWNFYRYTINIDYTKFGEITIPIGTNTVTGTFDVYVNGVMRSFTGASQWHYLTVSNDGTVYLDGVKFDGVQMVGKLIVFEIDNHRSANGGTYDRFYIAKNATFKLPVANEEGSENTDPYVNRLDNFFTPSNGSVSTADATDVEKGLNPGFVKVNTATIGGWQNAALMDIDISNYAVVQFYFMRVDTGAIYSTTDQARKHDNKEGWLEITLENNWDGTFNFLVDGESPAQNYGGAWEVNKLSDIAFNCNTGTFKYSNLIVDSAHYSPGKWEIIANNYFEPNYGSVSTEEVDAAASALGITQVNVASITDWQQKALYDIDISAYEIVKFYFMRVTHGSIYTSGRLHADKNNQWLELLLLNDGNGTFQIYVDGVKAPLSGYSVTSTITKLSDLKFDANKQSDGSASVFKYSNLIGYLAGEDIVGNKDKYSIVYETGNTEITYAAMELQKLFTEATGEEIYKSGYTGEDSVAGKKLVLGILPARDKGFNFAELGESDYVIKKDGETVYIYGKTGYGVVNGVYALLGDLFDLEIFYKDTYTLTKRTGFILTADAIEEKTSSLTFDYIWSGLGELKPEYNDDITYSYQMGFVTDYKVNQNNVHNATTLLDKYKETHPEWFYTEDGKTYGQIYLAAENFATGEGTLVRTVAEELFALLKNDTAERSIALLFSAMDEDIWPHGTGYSNSDALYSKYGTYAAENILFMNAVAGLLDEMLTAEPLGRSIQLELLCYNKTLVAPELSGLSEADKAALMMYKGTNISLVPMIAPVEGNRHLSFEDSRNKVKNPATGEIDSGSKTVAQVIEGWQALANGNDMHMWWYASDGYDFFVMIDTITNMQANYKFAAEHGITVFYNQSQGNNAVAPDWSRLKIYIQSSLQKDVNADVDALIEKFMNAYFGAGADSMKTLLAAQKQWYANFFSAVFEENEGHYTAGGFCYSDDIAKWHFTETPKKPTFSFIDTTKNTMLVNWMGYINAAKSAINADESLTAEQKAELCERVDLESLTIRYTLIEVFKTKTYDSSTSEFYKAAKELGVTRSSEGEEL